MLINYISIVLPMGKPNVMQLEEIEGIQRAENRNSCSCMTNALLGRR